MSRNDGSWFDKRASLACSPCSGSPASAGPVESRESRAAGAAALELRQQMVGPRHFLKGLPVNNGDALELMLADGRWIQGRYQWSHDEDDRPLLFLGGFCIDHGDRTACDCAELVIGIPRRAALRWPASTEQSVQAGRESRVESRESARAPEASPPASAFTPPHAAPDIFSRSTDEFVWPFRSALPSGEHG